MAKCVINVVAFTILISFGIGTVVDAQETAPATPELAPASNVSPPAPVEKKVEGEKERKANTSKKAGRGKTNGKKHR